MKLLIIDSNKDWVEMLMGWLKMHGFEVYRAYNGARARIEWMQQRPDLVILDPLLKDVDGLVLCQEMRSEHDALILIIADDVGVEVEIRG